MDKTRLILFLESKIFRGFIAGIGFLVILLLVFKAGEMIGFRKAGFSYQWGENYERNFGGPAAHFPVDIHDQGFLGGNGTLGNVMSINSSTLTVQDPGGTEKIIGLTKDTIVHKLRETVTPHDIQTNDHVVIIGTPDNTGQIEAKLIRIIPPPPSSNGHQ